MLRRAYASAQSRQSIRCSHTLGRTIAVRECIKDDTNHLRCTYTYKVIIRNKINGHIDHNEILFSFIFNLACNLANISVKMHEPYQRVAVSFIIIAELILLEALHHVHSQLDFWSRGYETFFMLNSTKHEISTAHENSNTEK